MHVITYTNQHGTKRRITIPAAQISAALDLTKALRAEGIEFVHTFWD